MFLPELPVAGQPDEFLDTVFARRRMLEFLVELARPSDAVTAIRQKPCQDGKFRPGRAVQFGRRNGEAAVGARPSSREQRGAGGRANRAGAECVRESRAARRETVKRRRMHTRPEPGAPEAVVAMRVAMDEKDVHRDGGLG